MADEKERASAVGCRFCVTKVNQDSGTVRHNTDIIGFDITVNNYGLLSVEELDSITNRKDPVHNLG